MHSTSSSLQRGSAGCPSAVHSFRPQRLRAVAALPNSSSRTPVSHRHIYDTLQASMCRGNVLQTSRQGRPTAVFAAEEGVSDTASGSTVPLVPKQITSRITNCRGIANLARLTDSHGQEFNHIHVSTALLQLRYHSKGQKEDKVKELGERLAELALAVVPDMGPRDVSSCLIALSALDLHSMKLITALQGKAIAALSEFNAMDMTQTLSALAKLGHPDEALTAALLQRMQPLLAEELTVQQLAITLFAIATLGHRDDAFVSQLLRAAELKLGMLQGQQMTTMIWSLAMLGHSDTAFTDAWLLAAKSGDSGVKFSSEDRETVSAAMKKLGLAESEFAPL